MSLLSYCEPSDAQTTGFLLPTHFQFSEIFHQVVGLSLVLYCSPSLIQKTDNEYTLFKHR